MFGKKIKCIYCGEKIKVSTLCPLCGREQKPLVSIETLTFEPIPAEKLALLREKKPGFLEKKIHAEMLEAAAERRICMATAIADGICYDTRRDEDGYYQYYRHQLISTANGSPIEGRIYQTPYFHLTEEAYKHTNEKPALSRKINREQLRIIRYETKKGTYHYTPINANDIQRLDEKLCEIEVHLYQRGAYSKNRF